MIVTGDSKLRFALMFAVKNSGGAWVESRLQYFSSLLEAESAASEFYSTRAKLHRKINSSYWLFGGNFEVDSFEWIACHTVSIGIYDQVENEMVSEYIVMQPYLEFICRYVEDL